MKEITDKLDFIKIKTSALQNYHQKNKKISHRLGENICKRHISKKKKKTTHLIKNYYPKETNHP